jgi:hypothetical protein
MAQKLAAQLAAQLPNTSQVQYACPKGYLATTSKLQYFARKQSSARRSQ